MLIMSSLKKILLVDDDPELRQLLASYLGRHGFDTLLLPNTDLDDAAIFAEGIRSRLAAAPVAVEGHDLRVTVSIGVAAADVATITLGDLMRRADQSLYGAKRGGRNRVQHSPGDAGKRMPSAPSAAA